MAAVVWLCGCDRQEIKVYQVAKETPAQRNPQNPHGHGDMQNSMMPPGHGMMGGQAQLSFQLPDGWKEKPAGQMRAAQFAVPGKDGAEADVSVIPFPGMTASREDIINIWREQLKLPPADKASVDQQVESVAVGGEKGDLYDLASEQLLVQNKYKLRILVAVLVRGDTSWFIKMSGPDDLVRESRPAFLNFLKTLRFAAPAEASTAMAATGLPTPDHTGKPTWQAPAHWKEVAPGPMLTARYSLSGDGGKTAEVTVSALAGDGGGALMNVNRWRGQLSLPPVAEGELAKLATVVAIGPNQVSVYDLKGTSAKSGAPARMVVLGVPAGGQTWFYKLLGDDAVVEKEKEAFLNFVRSAK